MIGIKEVHIKTYDEWLKYYKNATKEQVIEDLTRDVKYFADAVKDIKELETQLQQKENIIKELNDKIEDDKMIIEGNWGCIDSLRKDYNLQKNIIKEVREYIEDWQRFPHTNGSTHKELKNLIDILDRENKQ